MTGKPALRLRKPARNRVGRFLLITVAAGVTAAVLAIAIAALPTLLVLAFPSPSPPQMQASAIFPKASPTHRVVDVYDPPPKVVPRPTSSVPPAGANPTPRATTTPTHPPDE